MPQLTADQLREISRHRIPLSKVFDASGLKLQHATQAMSVDKEIVMINGPQCRNSRDHVLRSRYGKCVECNPAVLTFQERKRSEGYVYLAGSRRTGLLKIGMSSDPRRREAGLNLLNYGGASDWIILAITKSNEAGRLEYDAQHSLMSNRVEASYLKDGRLQGCFEIFQCPHNVALEALRKAAADIGGTSEYEAPIDGTFGSRSDDRSVANSTTLLQPRLKANAAHQIPDGTNVNALHHNPQQERTAQRTSEVALGRGSASNVLQAGSEPSRNRSGFFAIIAVTILAGLVLLAFLV